jgi:hypothetical protein
VGSSHACELESLKRCLATSKALNVVSLVTDRNRTVNKYMREQASKDWPALKHYFDVWHIAKGNYY